MELNRNGRAFGSFYSFFRQWNGEENYGFECTKNFCDRLNQKTRMWFFVMASFGNKKLKEKNRPPVGDFFFWICRKRLFWHPSNSIHPFRLCGRPDYFLRFLLPGPKNRVRTSTWRVECALYSVFAAPLGEPSLVVIIDYSCSSGSFFELEKRPLLI